MTIALDRVISSFFCKHGFPVVLSPILFCRGSCATVIVSSAALSWLYFAIRHSYCSESIIYYCYVYNSNYCIEHYRFLSTSISMATDMMVAFHISTVMMSATAIPTLNPTAARGRGGQVEWEGIKGNRSWPPVAPASKVSMMLV